MRLEAWPWDIFIDDTGCPQCECAVCDYYRWLLDGNEPADLPFPRELKDDEKTTHEPRFVNGVRAGTTIYQHFTWDDMKWVWQRTQESHSELIAHRKRGGKGKWGQQRYEEWKTVG